MTDVALILGTAKQVEIKQALQEGKIISYVSYLVSESNFYQTSETMWAFIKVATFLEDGWTAQKEWTTLAEHCVLTKEELGQAMNKLVGGSRYDKARAAEIDAQWTGAGAHPTRADMGAFLFFVSVARPHFNAENTELLVAARRAQFQAIEDEILTHEPGSAMSDMFFPAYKGDPTNRG